MNFSPTTVLVLSILGTAIVGADVYYQVHSTGPFNAQWYVGIAAAALSPVGSYLVGLVSKTPAEKRASIAASEAK